MLFSLMKLESRVEFAKPIAFNQGANSNAIRLSTTDTQRLPEKTPVFVPLCGLCVISAPLWLISFLSKPIDNNLNRPKYYKRT